MNFPLSNVSQSKESFLGLFFTVCTDKIYWNKNDAQAMEVLE